MSSFVLFLAIALSTITLNDILIATVAFIKTPKGIVFEDSSALNRFIYTILSASGWALFHHLS